MKWQSYIGTIGLFLWVASQTGCAKPAQLGGLGVFNPNGFAGRMALATRVNVPAASLQASAADAAKHSAKSNEPRPK